MTWLKVSKVVSPWAENNMWHEKFMVHKQSSTDAFWFENSYIDKIPMESATSFVLYLGTDFLNTPKVYEDQLFWQHPTLWCVHHKLAYPVRPIRIITMQGILNCLSMYLKLADWLQAWRGRAGDVRDCVALICWCLWRYRKDIVF
jgi:hypothetical protein